MWHLNISNTMLGSSRLQILKSITHCSWTRLLPAGAHINLSKFVKFTFYEPIFSTETPINFRILSSNIIGTNKTWTGCCQPSFSVLIEFSRKFWFWWISLKIQFWVMGRRWMCLKMCIFGVCAIHQPILPGINLKFCNLNTLLRLVTARDVGGGTRMVRVGSW